jgi:transposase
MTKPRPEVNDPSFRRAVVDDYATKTIGLKNLAEKYCVSITTIRNILKMEGVVFHATGVPLSKTKNRVAPEKIQVKSKDAKKTKTEKTDTKKTDIGNYVKGSAFPISRARLMAGR